jgi:hypothetical protein
MGVFLRVDGEKGIHTFRAMPQETMAQVGVWTDGPAPPALRSVLDFLETALGVPVRLVEDPTRPPARLLVAGPVPKGLSLDSPAIVVHLPVPLLEPRSRQEWIEPGPLPVFGEFERYTECDDLPWSYLGGGAPVSWTSRGHQTLFKVGFDPLGPLAWALGRMAERGPHAAAWHSARVDALPPEERPLVLTPWVDRLVRLLARLLDLTERAGGLTALPRWPGGARWAAALSHDVDMLFKWRFRSVLRLLLETPLHALDSRAALLARRWRELLDRLRGGRDPWFLVDELMDLEERRGLHSTLLFLAEPRDHQTFRYHLDKAQVRGLLARVRQRGHEVALHGGWSTHRDAARLADQRGRLRAAAGGLGPSTRQHWLRFLVDETWDAQERAGITVDSSLGFNDRPGFRAGTCLPFHPLDASGRPRRLLELPLILMDSQLFDEQGLETRAAARLAQEAVEQVRRVGGLFTLNWHPHTLCREDFPGRRALFEELLGVLARRDCWCAGLGDVAAHWEARATWISELPTRADEAAARPDAVREVLR